MVDISYENTPWGINDQAGRNRLAQRAQNLFSNNSTLLQGKHVLDLACNNGRMAYGALSAGAAKVTGVEIRPELISDGILHIAKVGLQDKMAFIEHDIFSFMDEARPGDFDVILCLGFLYHTVRHADFFRACARLKPETVIIDTNVAKNYFWFGRKMFGKPPALFLTHEHPNETRNTFDEDGLVYWPSCSYLEAMFSRAGFGSERVKYTSRTVSSWDAMEDYKNGTRASFVATRT